MIVSKTWTEMGSGNDSVQIKIMHNGSQYLQHYIVSVKKIIFGICKLIRLLYL